MEHAESETQRTGASAETSRLGGSGVTTGTSLWRETGDTDVSSLTKALARSIGAGSSPMAGEASAIHGITSRWGLTRLAAEDPDPTVRQVARFYRGRAADLTPAGGAGP